MPMWTSGSILKAQGSESASTVSGTADAHGATYADRNGVFLRNAWEKFGTWAPGATISTADGATTTAKNMEDEDGNVAFPVAADGEGRADFDRINPAWFRNLDRKLALRAPGLCAFPGVGAGRRARIAGDTALSRRRRNGRQGRRRQDPGRRLGKGRFRLALRTSIGPGAMSGSMADRSSKLLRFCIPH
jgi:hypothetical protein